MSARDPLSVIDQRLECLIRPHRRDWALRAVVHKVLITVIPARASIGARHAELLGGPSRSAGWLRFRPGYFELLGLDQSAAGLWVAMGLCVILNGLTFRWAKELWSIILLSRRHWHSDNTFLIVASIVYRASFDDIRELILLRWAEQPNANYLLVLTIAWGGQRDVTGLGRSWYTDWVLSATRWHDVRLRFL